MCGLLALPFLLLVACQSGGESGLPVQVSEPEAKVGIAEAEVPSGHPGIGASGQDSDRATNYPIPPGARNPMQDIVAFKTRLEKNPRDLEALISLGNANMMISRHDAAQDLYRRVLEINPKDLDTRVNLAIAYNSVGKTKQAFLEFEKNLKISPKHDPTMYNLGFLYFYDEKDFLKAREIWGEWLKLYPNSPAADDVRRRLADMDAKLSGIAEKP